MNQKPRGNRASNSTKESVTGFSFSGGDDYAQKDEYLEKGLVFTVRSIEFQEGRGYENTDRWAVFVTFEGRPDEILTFGCNERRDTQMRAAQAYIEAHGPIPNVRLKKSKAYYLETVTETAVR